MKILDITNNLIKLLIIISILLFSNGQQRFCLVHRIIQSQKFNTIKSENDTQLDHSQFTPFSAETANLISTPENSSFRNVYCPPHKGFDDDEGLVNGEGVICNFDQVYARR